MEYLVIAILGVVVVALATAVAPRAKIAGPLLLVAVGIGVSLLPFVPAIEVDPEIILVGVLPPLLYSAAVSLPAIEFRRDFGPIAGLSVLLVLFSSVALAFFFYALIPGLGIYLALALGAILSPTDAVATSIVKRLGISRRVVTMLEGESLLNDATSLVMLPRWPSPSRSRRASASNGGILGTFVWGVLVAIVIGAHRRLARICACARSSHTPRRTRPSASSCRSSPICPPSGSADRDSSRRSSPAS